ncbi:2Fe-2S iron-sulfur cluster binding domain-containing protein [Pseudonocardia bannensis]|uniref:2Fe-2S iron-sulfur cluster binding domain-containing protein n=1 Tax=Pseudonocardia bannensis TaxID=630973 RepID=A0A848DFF9_9PSEU|nr:2Fe-2S iron-sulfur cluster binding domain-containing protein [Pseudonocardia bannensis]
MAKVTYVEFDGTEHVVDVPVGTSVMKGAIRNNVPGIDADCGGHCSCATCHVHVVAPWRDKVGEATGAEQALLQFADGVDGGSRLSCQILITHDLDGLVVTMPEVQG